MLFHFTPWIEEAPESSLKLLVSTHPVDSIRINIVFLNVL